MPVDIVKVHSRAQLRKFIVFPNKLYRGCPNWVPALRGDEFDTFNPRRNGAFEYCEADCFLAYKDGKTAGRVAAIINHKANERWHERTVRFGWLDFIEDEEVLSALLDTVAAWGRERGCVKVKGPWGFTDMDKEGLLVEGFDKLSPFTCLYNYPYYDTLLKKIGFDKDVDWTQKISYIPAEEPPVLKYADLVEKRFGLHVVKARSVWELSRKYGMSIFHMYNESFAPLFEFTPLTDRQIKRYLQTYVPILNPKFVSVCVDSDDNPVGFAFCVPSLSRAVKKADGKLFPFGFIHILRALRRNDTLEALLIGVLPECQGKGAPLLMYRSIQQNCIGSGIRRMIYNPQLESNVKVQALDDIFPSELYMRRRAYVREIK